MTAPSLWGRKDSPFAFSAYNLNDYQQFLVSTLNELAHKDALSRFLDNRGYLNGLLKLLEFFPHSFLEEKDSKLFNDLCIPLQQIAKEHIATGILPTEAAWSSMMKSVGPFSN